MLTITDITFAAILAFMITWIVKLLIRIFKTIKFIQHGAENMEQINSILQRCYSIFSTEIIQFNGETFKRGTKVRVITDQSKVLEGEFIGMSNDNVVCIFTSTYIAAHNINNIKKIYSLDKIHRENL